mgnify:FL=1
MKKIVKLLLIIIWLFVIFLFSNQDGSTSTSLTNGILEKYLFFVDSDMFFMIIRKMAHITEYFILGILVLNFINEFKVDKKIIISILICFILASFDEFHQLFIPDRTGRLLDVFIDMIGASLGILILSLIKNHKKQR